MGPAVVGAVRWPVPAEVLTARVSAVTTARAATRRLRMRRGGGCGCMQGPFAPRQPPDSGCTLALTLCRRGDRRALEETEGGKAGSRKGECRRVVIVSQVTGFLSAARK
ncbi:hypothetical protein GCM10010521_15670 [Streptomyces rameus]|uniref:Uncharacterized protein n=1 Tax=Streptomyces rameus TaxID=68261 RepID=A0ABP6MYG6_9ACTN